MFGLVLKPFRVNIQLPRLPKSSPPKCVDCRYYDRGKCLLFKYVPVTDKPNDYVYYVDAEDARKNQELCGPIGYYFEKIR